MIPRSGNNLFDSINLNRVVDRWADLPKTKRIINVQDIDFKKKSTPKTLLAAFLVLIAEFKEANCYRKYLNTQCDVFYKCAPLVVRDWYRVGFFYGTVPTHDPRSRLYSKPPSHVHLKLPSVFVHVPFTHILGNMHSSMSTNAVVSGSTTKPSPLGQICLQSSKRKTLL